MREYSKVFIIGNGFDLNLGLKTSYSDFIDSHVFKELLSDENKLATYLRDKHDDVNWIDIELELVTYASNVANTELGLFKLEYKNLCKALVSYLLSLPLDQIERDSDAFSLLKNEIGNLDFIIFDFNYTSTIKNILTELGIASEEINNRVIKMHGTIAERDIILGIHDNTGKLPASVYVKKSSQDNFNSTRIRIGGIIKKCSELYIFGHSLGKTDEGYFKDTFKSLAFSEGEVIKLKLYHHGDHAKDEFYVRLNDLTASNANTFKERVSIDPRNTQK